MAQQIVVMKSGVGFVDRLQALSHIIEYCLINKAVLCVDWRDYSWGQGKWDFHDFFEILGIYTIPLDIVIRIVNAKIVPVCWTNELIKKPLQKHINTVEYSGPIMQEGYKKIEGDIIVTNCKGYRYYHTRNILTNIRFKKNISDLIQQRLLNYYLPATVVHLRGTDRFTPDVIDILVNEYNLLDEESKKHVYHISDSVELMNEWTKKVPYSQLCNSNCSILQITDTSKKATHLMNSSELDSFGIRKYELIIDSLADFVALAFATSAVGQTKSVFFEVARKLAKYGGPDAIAAWLNGYKPQTKNTTN
jgi:hypothetical protein